MPHKHKRDKSKNDSSYDLPPTTIARPLPVLKPPPPTKTSHPPRRTRNPPPNPTLEDDTPRAFKRLITNYKPPPGLDDGHPPPKKQKQKQTPTLKIHPSEPLSSFSTRVNAALPITHLPRSKPQTPLSPNPTKTKTEVRHQKMHHQWRQAALRRKELEEAAQDEAEISHNPNPKSKSTSKPDPDLWPTIPPPSGLIGLHDVVLAPPKLLIPKEKMRVGGRGQGRESHGARGLTGQGKLGTGGLKRQGELSEARKKVIEGYRLMMKERGRGVS